MSTHLREEFNIIRNVYVFLVILYEIFEHWYLLIFTYQGIYIHKVCRFEQGLLFIYTMDINNGHRAPKQMKKNFCQKN